MDSKKLVKVIKALVEAEVSKRQEVFLKKTFPKILDEAVKARMKTITSNKTEEVDPFSLANAVLDEDRKEFENMIRNNMVIILNPRQLRGSKLMKQINY